jgi:photosystem II stability/assembly factor-like uncharacterized protein
MKLPLKALICVWLLYGLSFAQQHQWRLASGTEGIYIADIAIYHTNPDTLYATGFQFLISTDQGEHWDSLSGAPAYSVIEIDPFDSKRIYLSHGMLPFDGTEVVMTTDGGLNWTSLFIGFNQLPDLPIIETDPGDLNTVYVDVTPSTFYRSSDQGNTWDSIPSPDDIGLSSLAIAPSNNNILYAGYTWPVKIYKSTDRSQTWTLLPFPLSNYFYTLVYIAVHPVNPDIVYVAISAGDSRGVYKTMDGGQTWEQKNNGLDSLQGYDWINTIVINPKEPDELYLGTYDIYKTTDGGNNWFRFTQGMGSRGHVKSIKIDTLNGRIYAGTARGIYIYDSLATAIGTDDLQVPKTFYLYQNYPNPFNSRTTLTYVLGSNSDVSLSIYNLRGQLVKTLVNQAQSPGSYTIMWDGTGSKSKALPSGVYFYRIEAVSKKTARQFHKTRKMVLLR